MRRLRGLREEQRQRTIRREAEYEGIGLFSGRSCRMRFIPGPPGGGVVFARKDLAGAPEVPAELSAVVQKARRSSLARDGVGIETVEHVLAALGGLGIDNLRIEMDADEVPAGDGSALPFVEVLQSAGIEEQDAPKRSIAIRSPIGVTGNGASISAMPEPAGGLEISYTLDYENRLVPKQHLSVKVDAGTFVKEVAAARTFCLESEVKPLLEQGFGKGASYENTLVISRGGVVNNTLRFEDEFVRHKILDLIGDLFLLGAAIDAHVVGLRSGHALTFRLLREMEKATSLAVKGATIDVREIWQILPHRYPFLLIDRVIEVEEFKRAVGIKNVTINEEFFQGHFPRQPIMPGVLQIEAMAQLAGVMFLRSEKVKGKLALITGLDNVMLRRPVVPGDQLVLEAEMVKARSRSGIVHACAKVDGKIVSEADIKFMLVDAP